MTDHTRSTTDPQPATQTEEPDHDRIAVLHVEPDSRSAELLATFAKRSAGPVVSVRSVDSMEAGLSAVGAADCVVTEQRLSDGSGVTLVERLRADGRDVPVVFYTTCRSEDAEARAFEAGADAYFEKRSTRGQHDRLLDRIRALVDGKGARYGRTGSIVSGGSPSSASSPKRLTSEE